MFGLMENGCVVISMLCLVCWYGSFLLSILRLRRFLMLFGRGLIFLMMFLCIFIFGVSMISFLCWSIILV